MAHLLDCLAVCRVLTALKRARVVASQNIAFGDTASVLAPANLDA
jgi:hypothetical protein